MTVTKAQLQKMVDVAEDAQLAYETMDEQLANWDDADSEEKADIRTEIEGAVQELLIAAGKLREMHEKANW